MSSAVRLAACECLTPFGGTADTLAALLRGESALRATPVLGREGGEAVPLALLPGRALDETAPPAWLAALRGFLAPVCGPDWGAARRPVCVTSSNFGVGSLYAFRRSGDAAHTPHGSTHGSVALVRGACGWGGNVTVFSHACVSAHLGLLHAARLVGAGAADEALVVSYDFLSPFVAGGFHALKILNTGFPAPYRDRATGSIGLGDGAGFAIVARDRGDFALGAHALHNEMFHATANRPDGAGFAAAFAPVARAAAGRGLRGLWVKGHGTGTLEAGRLETAAVASAFPGARLTGWKGGLGHTLGSCGLVELAVAAAAMRGGRAPGTPGGEAGATGDGAGSTTGDATAGTTAGATGGGAPALAGHVALEPINTGASDGVVCASNAFGGAHAALLLHHA